MRTTPQPFDGPNVIELPLPRQTRPAEPPPVTFDRRELDQLLRVYGRMVAEGEWRDYAIDFGRDRATFS